MKTAALRLVVATSVIATGVEGQQANPVAQAVLDHVPIAVRDLDSATATYSALGFAIKPGRLHPNSLVNAFVKFPDGSLLELITASEDGDSLATWYRDFIELREGAAFIALETDDMKAVARSLESSGIGFVDTGPQSAGFRTVALDVREPFRRIFFIEYDAPIVEPDSIVSHANTVSGIGAVWLVVEDMRSATEWLVQAGWTAEDAVPFQPFKALGRAFPTGRGDLVLVAPTDLAGYTVSYLNSMGPSILGVTLVVDDIARARDVLQAGTGRRFVVRAVPGKGLSLLVPPRYAHGLWLEFLQRP